LISPTFYTKLLCTLMPNAQKRLLAWQYFCAFGICGHKSFEYNAGEINPWSCIWQYKVKTSFKTSTFWHSFEPLYIGKSEIMRKPYKNLAICIRCVCLCVFVSVSESVSDCCVCVCVCECVLFQVKNLGSIVMEDCLKKK